MGARKKTRIAVIGGGLAGLSAAAVASARGCEVVLAEVNSGLGGLAGSFRRDGYTWDRGARAVENSGVVRPFLRYLGIEKSIGFIPEPASLGVEGRLVSMQDEKALDEWFAAVAALYPGQERSIAAIRGDVATAMAASATLYSGSNPIFAPLWKMLPKSIWWNIRNARLFKEIADGTSLLSKPLDTRLAELGADTDLSRLLSQPFFPGTSVFFGFGYYRFYPEYAYPAAGMGAIPDALAAFISARGGSLYLGRKVSSILVGKGRARGIALADGSAIEADAVIAAADAKELVESLLPQGAVPEKFVAKIEKAKPGDSVFTVYLEVDMDPGAIVPITLAHAILAPDRAGLALLSPEGLFSSSSVEVGIPAMRNPALAPAGKTGVIASAASPYALWEKLELEGPAAREAAKKAAAAKIIEALTVFMPWLPGRIEGMFTATPLAIRDYTGNSGGSITGWSHISEECGSERDFRNFAKAVETPVRNLYRAGHWTFTPAGIPVAIMTGKLSADLACMKNGVFGG
jgi:phytoene dehydrogenase-like protein